MVPEPSKRQKKIPVLQHPDENCAVGYRMFAHGVPERILVRIPSFVQEKNILRNLLPARGFRQAQTPARVI